MKVCFKCKEEKSIELFFKNKNSKDGLHASCKNCQKNGINYDSVKRSEYYNNTKYRDREKNKERRRNYYINNKEKENLQSREYKESNRNDLNKKVMIYYYNNKDTDKFKERRRRYKKDRYDNDILFKLYINTGSLIRNSFNNNGYSKKSKTFKILGCSFEEFKLYLESKFENWMTWENRGLYNGELNYGWDIDHIIPSSSAKSEDDIIKLNYYTNLQPLCSKINRDIKKDFI
jgi:hypothetical protein